MMLKRSGLFFSDESFNKSFVRSFVHSFVRSGMYMHACIHSLIYYLLISHRMPGHLHGSGTRGACATVAGAVYERGRLGSSTELSLGAQLHGRVVGDGIMKLF